MTGITAKHRETLLLLDRGRTFDTEREWLEARRTSITGTDVAALIGVSPYKTPLQVWQDKLGVGADFHDNPRMKAGRMLEDAIVQWYCEEYGQSVVGRNLYITSQHMPYFSATVDGIIDGEVPGILECKNTTQDWSAIPPHYYAQVQWYMHVSYTSWAHFVALYQGHDLRHHVVRYDAPYCERLHEAAERFWWDNVVGGAQPAPQTPGDVLALYPPGQTVIEPLPATPELAEAALHLRTLKDQIKALDEEKDRLERHLKVSMAEHEELVYEGARLLTWRYDKTAKPFLDAKALADAHPNIYNAFLRDGQPVRRFLLK